MALKLSWRRFQVADGRNRAAASAKRMGLSLMWKIASATVIGTSHRKSGSPCQDAGLCRMVHAKEGEILLAVASDGAGSAKRSELGAKIATDCFIRDFAPMAEKVIDKAFVQKWLVGVCQEMALAAQAEGLQLNDLACTLLGAIVKENSALFFQVGDGAIVYAMEGETQFREAFWPQHGEFANQTNFIIQENVLEILEYAEIEGHVSQIALFTDGIERLILDFSQKRVHSPALQPIFDWLAKSELIESDPLSDYLDSEAINSRTDDDKTLIMATRAW